MSRCFPFPPPGYEPKAGFGIIDLLTKEKHREKKDKKEKRDKEKREHKEKRDKDRRKDRHKEKKDQKLKDKKKDKCRDKGRTSKDIKAEGRSHAHNELHIEEIWQKTDVSKDSKLEDLDKRTRDDGAENPVVRNFTNSIQRNVEAVQKRRNDSNIAISQRRAVSAISMEKERNKLHGCGSSVIPLEKETSKIHEKVAVGRGAEESRNHGISGSIESVSGFAIRKTEGSRIGVEKKKCSESSFVSNSAVPGLERGGFGTKTSASGSLAAAQRRKDVLGIAVENLSPIHGKTEVVGPPSLHGRINDVDSVLAMEKGRTTSCEMFQVGQAAEKVTHKKVEGMKGKQAEDRKKKSKSKDKDRLTKEKKQEENIVGNAEDRELNKLRNFGKKDKKTGTLNSKPLTPHKDNAIAAVFIDGTMKKRKYLDTNGYSQENDERPDKIPRVSSSSPSPANGWSLKLQLTAPSAIPGAINNSRPDRLLENKERKLNGNGVPRASGELAKNSDVSLAFLPHPDSKYLSQIYAVPKTAEFPAIDGQDWLFDCHDSLWKSKIELKAEKIPQVFAEALRIESADVLALPYVVPF